MTRIRRVDIEGDLIGWLPGALAAAGWLAVSVTDVLTKGESVAVFRTGGVMRDLVTDAAQITIECAARTKKRSGDLANEINSLIHALAGDDVNGHAVQHVDEFAGPAFFPTEDRPTRYTQTLSLHVSAEVVG
jgi:hypothetical protein